MIPEQKHIWFNGKLIPWKDAKVHVLTHSLHYGSAVFEGIRLYDTPAGPQIFRLNDHTMRLIKSAKSIQMKLKYSAKQINKAIIDVIRANKLKSAYIRPLIYFGYGIVKVDPKGSNLGFAITAWPWKSYSGKDSLKVGVSQFIRLHPKSELPTAKISGYYINSLLAIQDVQKRGFDEALLLDYKGNVAEGSAENIFIIKNKKLLTPKLGDILPGITRESIITISKDLGYKLTEETLKLKDVINADEAFFTGTATGITPINQVEKRKFQIGPITKQLKEIYTDIVTGRNNKYCKWLTKTL